MLKFESNFKFSTIVLHRFCGNFGFHFSTGQQPNVANEIHNDGSLETLSSTVADENDANAKLPKKGIAQLYKKTNWKMWWSATSYGNHPGVCRLPTISIPERLSASASNFLKDYEKEVLQAVSQKLNNILLSRRVSKKHYTQPKLKKNVAISPVDASTVELAKMPSDEYYVESLKEKQEHSELIQDHYFWKEIYYDHLNAAAFLVARSPACFASSLRVMSEIKKHDPHFTPYSMLDFGSGTGMSVWAANTLWKDSLKQYVCVDTSKAMNKLAFYLFSGGNYDRTLPGMFIRQSIPTSFAHEQYDIVIASYCLSEFSSEKERRTVVKRLWEKTQKYLVLVEHGNFYGYLIMMEARNLLLDGLEGPDKQKARRSKWAKNAEPAKIFSPCPHELDCPKWNSKNACFFSQKFFTPQFYHLLFPKANPSASSAFSYAVFEKNGKIDTSEKAWPRVIDEPNFHRGCATCHICTPMGDIEHVAVTKQHYGKDLMYIAKKSLCGDSIPLTPRKHNLEDD